MHLLRRGDEVLGFDNLNAYYDIRLKHARLDQLRRHGGFRFMQGDIADRSALDQAVGSFPPDVVINLAAQAGVRYSLECPAAYIDSNLVGFANILEVCRQIGVRHLVFASSSSVYGANTKMPFSIHDNVDHPLSLYAATKKANELMAHSYSHLFGLPVTGLRLFTVYGPWGRPDMALFKFARAILDGTPIDVYNHGEMSRDFTYVDDIVEGIIRVADRIPVGNAQWKGERPDPATSLAPYRVYNIGNNSPVSLLRVIEILETCLGRPAIKRFLPMQPGDVPATCADIDDLQCDTGFTPDTPIQVGIQLFVDWFVSFNETPPLVESTLAVSAVS
jgi:UDP-glucuronate 4-epimerase